MSEGHLIYFSSWQFLYRLCYVTAINDNTTPLGIMPRQSKPLRDNSTDLALPRGDPTWRGNNLKKRNTNYRKALFFSTSTRAGEVVENYPDMDYLRARHYRIEFSRPFSELHRTALKLMLTLWNSIKTVDKSPTTDPP